MKKSRIRIRACGHTANAEIWRNIVAISAGAEHAVGLKSDGTVVAVGNNEHGQCNVESRKDIDPLSEELLQQRKLEEEQCKLEYDKHLPQGLAEPRPLPLLRRHNGRPFF